MTVRVSAMDGLGKLGAIIKNFSDYNLEVVDVASAKKQFRKCIFSAHGKILKRLKGGNEDVKINRINKKEPFEVRS